MSKQDSQKTIKTSIGGQAVIEGVMMRGPKVTALSVRLPDNTISTEEWPTPSMSAWYKRTPFVRGIFNFVDSLTTGYKSLMKAAEKAGLDDEEEEASPFEQKLRNALGDKFMPFLEGCILVVSLIIAIFFFTFLPTTIVNFFRGFFEHPLALSALEGVIKMVILIGYLAAVSQMSDIRRVFMYHGAEHKTIHCFEHEEELTVENVRKYSKHHPRCGTAFLFVVMIISILIYSIVPRFSVIWLNIGMRILLLPLIAGISYEFNRFAGKHNNRLTKILRAPGMAMQRFTTREPDDDMIEVAIVALKEALKFEEAYEAVPNYSALGKEPESPDALPDHEAV